MPVALQITDRLMHASLLSRKKDVEVFQKKKRKKGENLLRRT